MEHRKVDLPRNIDWRLSGEHSPKPSEEHDLISSEENGLKKEQLREKVPMKKSVINFMTRFMDILDMKITYF
jgi:hypothetical protein